MKSKSRRHPSKADGPTRFRVRTTAQGGFSLIEMMIAMTLGLLVIAAAIAVFLSNKQAYITNNGLGQVQDGSRIAFELMVRDIRETGLNGCGDPGRVANVLNNGPNAGGTVNWYEDIGNAMIGYDGTATDPAVTTATAPNPTTTNGQRVSGTSSIELVGADGLGVSLASDTPSSATMTLNESSSNLGIGDFIIICDPNHAVITELTNYTSGSPITIVHAYGTGTSTPGNCSQGMGFPTLCGNTTGNAYQFSPNTQLAKLYAADWYIGYNPLGGKSLYRMTLVKNASNVPTATAQEMVRNVSNMQITYLTSTGLGFVSATSVGTTQAAWALVNAVNLSFTFQSVSQSAGTNTTSSANSITRTVSTTVTLRNRVQ